MGKLLASYLKDIIICNDYITFLKYKQQIRTIRIAKLHNNVSKLDREN